MGDLLHLDVDRQHLGRSLGDVVDRQTLAPHDARSVLLRQRRLQLFPLAGAETVGEVVGVRDVDRDDLGVALLDDGWQELPLIGPERLGTALLAASRADLSVGVAHDAVQVTL